VAELAAAWVLRGEPRWIAPALLGCALLSFALALASYRAIHHRAEYRADAIAVELAGAAAVRAWLTSMQASEQRRGRRPWAATLTHPRTEARLARLPS
jgi:Zn-dependent protease with chaperone function